MEGPVGGSGRMQMVVKWSENAEKPMKKKKKLEKEKEKEKKKKKNKVVVGDVCGGH